MQVVDEVEEQRCESGKIVHAKHTPTRTHTWVYVCAGSVCKCVWSLCQSLLWSLVTLQFACLLFPFQGVFQIIPPLFQHCQSLSVCVCVLRCVSYCDCKLFILHSLQVQTMSTCNFVCCTHTVSPSLAPAKDILKIEILLNNPVSMLGLLHNTFLAKFYNTVPIRKLFSRLRGLLRCKVV